MILHDVRTTMSSEVVMTTIASGNSPHHQENNDDHASSSNHGNDDIKFQDKANANNHMIITSSASCYIPPNLLSPSIPFSPPKLLWQSPPPIPLPITKYPFNSIIPSVTTVGIHGTSSSVLPVTGSLQHVAQNASRSFQLPSGSPIEVPATSLRPAKRKRDESFINASDPEDHVSASKAEHTGGAGEGSDFIDASGAMTSSGVGGGGTTAPQSVSWCAHQVDSWYEMCDAMLQDIPPVSFRVEANKGFTYSTLDEAFVCQKKNHFQVTITCQVAGTPRFIKMKDGGLQSIKKFMLCLHGIKLESEMSIITLDQSLVNRSKKKLEDLEIELEGDVSVCKTIGRLHFSETTLNNMRKKGRPNPDQKYFSLVVALIAHTANGNFYTVVAHVSERIIVRASNPGTFDNDSDIMWSRSANSPNNIYYMGHVGINTDKPTVALAVHGSAQVTGNLLQPSDSRVKDNVLPTNPSKQLDNITKLRVCHYSYTPEYAATVGMETPHDSHDVGLIAQELQQVIPDAIQCSGDLELHNGECVEQFLCVKKDRILMESIGAIQELNRINHQLSARIEVLERGFSWQGRCLEHYQSMKCLHSIKTTTLRRIFLILMIILMISIIMVTVLHHHGNRNQDDWEISLSNHHHHHNELLKHSAGSL